MKLGMKHQRFKLIIFCSNDNPVLILTHFTARSNFATSAFIWENVIMMDTLEIIIAPSNCVCGRAYCFHVVRPTVCL